MYSNGIIVLAVLSVALLVVTRAKVASLIPLYACTVFTGFTMAGAGMTRYHLTHPGPARRGGLVTSGLAFAASAAVTLIFVTRAWSRLGLGAVPLEVIECPDRRLVRAATELADDLARDGDTEVLMVLPRRAYRGVWSHVLHDHTADRIVAAVTQIPNVSATIAPFDVHRLLRRRVAAADSAEATSVPPEPAGGWRGPASRQRGAVVSTQGGDGPHPVPGTTPLADVRHRQRTKISGRVRAVRVQPWAGVPTYECTLVDSTGALTIVFLGRRAIAGVDPGVKLLASGTVGTYQGRLAMLNPSYELLEPSPRRSAAS